MWTIAAVLALIALAVVYGYRMPRKDDWLSRSLGLRTSSRDEQTEPNSVATGPQSLMAVPAPKSKVWSSTVLMD
jgi:hypothetical protein